MWKSNYITSSMVIALTMAVDMRNMDESVMAQLHADCPGTGLAQIEADCPGTGLAQTEARESSLAKKSEEGEKHSPMFRGNGLAQTSPAEKFLEFSQVQQSDRWHSCQATMRRLENTTDNFTAILNGSEKFTDVNFPIDDALYWVDAGQSGQEMDRLT